MDFQRNQPSTETAQVSSSKLEREIEQLLSYPIKDDGELDRRLTTIREENQRLTTSYPNVAEHMWNAAVESVEKEGQKWK